MSPAHATYIEVDGARLAWVAEGSGTPVVFSHGAGSDLRYWEPQRRAFSRSYRFVAYSRRFFGQSSALNGDNSLETHAADLSALIERLDAGPVHLVGFSATVGLRVAIDRPDLLLTLTVLEPNAPLLLRDDDVGRSALAWWRRENDRVEAEAGDDPARRAALWFELVNHRGAGTFDLQAPIFRDMWLENMTANRPPPSPSTVECGALRRIATPTLAIATEWGMPYSQLIVERTAACIPRCERVVISNATHFVSYQDPDAFNAAVLRFLAAAAPESG